MKKSFSLFFVWLLAMMCSAQIQVASTGNVSIGDTLSSNVKLFVNTSGARGTGIYSLIESARPDAIAVFGEVNGAIDTQIAVMGRASSYLSNTGSSIGVLGIAGNRKAGYNYGVLGRLDGNRNGAGVFGSVSSNITPQINGKYAGYFYGNVHVTGTLTTGVTTTMSDARYKSNIQQINATALAKIAALNPVHYTMLSGEAIDLANTEPTDTTSTVTMTTSGEDDLAKANQIHYGLLAQEVKELYPELVHEDAAGVMSINYTELIPLLIQAVQDLSEQVSALSNSSSASVRKQAPKQQDSTTEAVVATLYQNNPNPFTEATVISYIVPVEAQQASIYIYNMLGEQLGKYDISVFGDGNVTIGANELYAGTFLYSLVVDGKLIDTKQMIITQ
jgi:hypothetical protein